MTTLFDKEYAEYRSLMEAYHSTESEDKRSHIREEYAAFKSRITNSGEAYNKYFWVFVDAKERGNNYIDISDPISENKVFDMVRTLKALGFNHFTISSSWSGAIENAWVFTQNGCTLTGMVEINSQYRSLDLNGYEKAHALLLTIN